MYPFTTYDLSITFILLMREKKKLRPYPGGREPLETGNAFALQRLSSRRAVPLICVSIVSVVASNVARRLTIGTLGPKITWPPRADTGG